ncbi:MAG: CPBP family intramembrane metalloprotease [Oscillospiraceae bacterium]|nr:CPBP family intramembrane metalloprotease [Oscillospiraceae bacterium]
MNLLTQKILSSIVQILLFALIPFIWWCITARRKINFFQWIGIKRIASPKENKTALWIVGTTIVFLAVSVFILYTVRNIETATSEFLGLGMKALPAVLVYAVLNTSFPEELLFRGFLLKRLSHKFGFLIGNAVQSLLFGLLHGAMFFMLTDIPRAILIIGFTGGIAWCMGYVNEQKADGSILPSWCIHAIANIFSGVCSAFLLF